ncbi:alpha/beta hydrolase [Psychrobacillus sp. BL-248-WT-3]|uniref:alpha/beta fold hydrolase n=1 Tax=Psychrobacillus sp. BL-248-WT-3 TaxID=2725306 RepID=UPI00146A1CE0|nr:alpha/beta hydrolase [Psychrobacillus sp. BL-248-WT-3]NME05314.1 alpha/beta hydrolase [Psychrobacillus sp. BL-248-WT-3]HIT90379.1 alpha/beta hydrolase [Candidatus Merdenecus merdavium]
MTEKIIRFNNVHICTESFGDIRNPTILLIMGATASMIWWEEEFCNRLSNQGFHVIRYDNRDVGKSITYEYGHPQYTFEDLADDAIQVLDAYKVDKAHIVGMSMGGIITQIVALKHPSSVLTISLVMTSNYDTSLPKKNRKVTEAFEKISIDNWQDKEKVIEYVIDRSKVLAGPKHPFNEEKIRKLAGEDFKRTTKLQSMENHQYVKGWGSYLSRTHEINVPTQVIHGTKDPVVPYEHGAYLSKIIPNAVLVTLDGAGHELHYNDWEEIINAISKHAVSS